MTQPSFSKRKRFEMSHRRFVILDRDGTIIVERNYLSDYREVELLPGVVDGLCRLKDLALGIIIISNQEPMLFIANAGAAVSSLMTGLGSGETYFVSYSGLPDTAKLLLCLAMLLGRLEFFTVLALLSPSLWRR